MASSLPDQTHGLHQLLSHFLYLFMTLLVDNYVRDDDDVTKSKWIWYVGLLKNGVRLISIYYRHQNKFVYTLCFIAEEATTVSFPKVANHHLRLLTTA